MESKDFLKQVKTLDKRIKNKLIEKQQWHDLALTITANMGGEKVQSSGSQSKMADAVEVCVDMEGEILREVINLRNTKTKVIQTIERLDNATAYDVLHMRYIQHLSLQDVADHYKKDYSWATTVHGRALRYLQAILDKEKDDA